MSKAKEKLTIGRRDWAAFPDLGLPKVEVKTDTGAYTSSIHCDSIKLEEGVLHFHINIPHHPELCAIEHKTREFKTRKVRSSNGAVQERFSIKSSIELLGKKWPIELTLADRSIMRFPVLLGRKFLKNKFVVDVSKINLSLK